MGGHLSVPPFPTHPQYSTVPEYPPEYDAEISTLKVHHQYMTDLDAISANGCALVLSALKGADIHQLAASARDQGQSYANLRSYKSKYDAECIKRFLAKGSVAVPNPSSTLPGVYLDSTWIPFDRTVYTLRIRV